MEPRSSIVSRTSAMASWAQATTPTTARAATGKRPLIIQLLPVKGVMPIVLLVDCDSSSTQSFFYLLSCQQDSWPAAKITADRTRSALFPLFHRKALRQTNPRRRQSAVLRMEDVLFEKVGRQAEALSDFARSAPTASHKEAGQRQKAVAIGFSRRQGNSPAAARGHVGELIVVPTRRTAL